MPSILQLMKATKSLPAWLRASLNERALRSAAEEAPSRALIDRLEMLDNTVVGGVDPEVNFQLWLNSQKSPLRRMGRTAEDTQERLPGFGVGGSVLARALRYVKEMPFHSDMPLGRYVKGVEQTTPLYVNPDASDMAALMKRTSETAVRDSSAPTIRYLLDMKQPRKLYAADGNEILHSDMRGHLGLSADDTLGELWVKGRQRNTPQDVLEYLRTFQDPPIKKAAGGLACLRSKK